jgi:4-amino-4-deoxy-L-arabinose transferase-like glycosyltransferase
MNKTPRWIHWVALIVVIAATLLLYLRISRDYLFDWDEAIYATIGREMLRTHAWLTPTWNGALWIEKPPAIAWVGALGMAIFGTNELGARVFMPIFAGLALYGVYKIGTKLKNGYVGLAAMGLLGYFDLFLSRARTVNADGMLMAAIVWTVYTAVLGSSPWLLGLAAASAIMIKGPAGVLAILIAAPLLFKKPRSYLLSTIYYLLLYTVPWHLYQLIVHGASFYKPYLLEQVLTRATSPIEFHLESRWFYFIFLYKDLGLGMLIGVILGLSFIAYQIWIAKSLPKYAITAWWALLPLAIFTLAKTRLSWYILPIYPALALLLAYAIEALSIGKVGRRILSILVIGICTQMLWHIYQYVEPSRPVSVFPDQLIVAENLHQLAGNNIAMLVSASERTAQAILPVTQTISSSFRYGGAPSVAWYTDKHVDYYYNYDNFVARLLAGYYPLAIVTTADVGKVPSSYSPVVTTNGYVGFAKGGSDALR